MLKLTLVLISSHQPETTATLGSIHRLCHSNYDLSTPMLTLTLMLDLFQQPTLIHSSDFGNKDPGYPALETVVVSNCLCSW